MPDIMPHVSRLKLPPLDLGKESLGERLARLRKERSFTQTELAEKMGILQNLVSAYERGRLRLSADMAIRFANVLAVSVDQLLGIKNVKTPDRVRDTKLWRRFTQVEKLSADQRKPIIQVIDSFLEREKLKKTG